MLKARFSRGPRAPLRSIGALGLLLLFPAGARAWTPPTRQLIAAEAGRLAPRDLARQIEKHDEVFLRAVVETEPGSGPMPLDRSIDKGVAEAVAAIRAHRPFEEIVRRLGGVAAEVAYASSPFAGSNGPRAARYSSDYLEYAESVESRFPLIFYGIVPGLERSPGVGPIVAQALRRAERNRPLLEMEYQRIGYASGLGAFDDRSTAFGIASTSFSHAVTDVMTVLRYIWLKAGGVDERAHLPTNGGPITILSRAYRAAR